MLQGKLFLNIFVVVSIVYENTKYLSLPLHSEGRDRLLYNNEGVRVNI